MTPRPPDEAITMEKGVTRALRLWFPLVFVLLFLWLDWISHRDILFVIVIGGGSLVLLLFMPEVVARLRNTIDLRALWEQVPRRFRPLTTAVPALVYLYLRGQGSAQTGELVVVLLALAVAGVVVFGPQIDARLAGWYTLRNRVAPRVLRMVLVPVAAILIAFAVIHGSLSDLPALWGAAPTLHPRSPFGHEPLIAVGSLLSMACAYLLLREPGV